MKFLGENRNLISEQLKHLGVELDELRLHRHTHLIGKTILDLQNMAEGNLVVISLQRSDGRMLHSGLLEEK